MNAWPISRQSREGSAIGDTCRPQWGRPSCCWLIAAVLVAGPPAQAVKLDEGFVVERLMHTGILASVPEELEAPMEAALTGQAGVTAAIEAAAALSKANAFTAEQRSLMELLHIVLLAQAGRQVEMLGVANACLGNLAPGIERLALCTFLADRIGKSSMAQMGLDWEERARWLEALADAAMTEYVPHDRDVVDALRTCAEAMDQLAHRCHLDIVEQIPAGERGESASMEREAELARRDFAGRARAIALRAEQLAYQVSVGAVAAPEGRFDRAEAGRALGQIQRQLAAYAKTIEMANLRLREIEEAEPSQTGPVSAP